MENKMTLKDLLVRKEILQKALGFDLPVKLSYRLSKLVSEVNKEYEFFAKANADLVKKYGVKDEKGNYKVDNEDEKKFTAFSKEMDKLFNEEVVFTFNPLKIEDFGDELKLSPLEVNLLVGLVIEKEKEEEKKEEVEEGEVVKN